MAFPNTPVLDSFNRANEGPPPSANWSTMRGTGHTVLSNQMAPNANAVQGSSWSVLRFDRDQECRFTAAVLDSPNQGHNVYLRVQTATNGDSDHYEVDFERQTGNDKVAVWKEVATVYTQLGADIDLGGELAAGDQFGASVTGSTIEVWYNNVSQGTRTDSEVSGTGFIGIVSGTDVPRFDDFGGGDQSLLTISRSHVSVP